MDCTNEFTLTLLMFFVFMSYELICQNFMNAKIDKKIILKSFGIIEWKQGLHEKIGKFDKVL